MSTQTPAPSTATATAPRTKHDPANAVINGIRCDTTTAELVLVEPAGVFAPVELGRFDAVIYRNDQGYWFVVRPLDPEEAREWITRIDTVAAKHYFPDGPPPA